MGYSTNFDGELRFANEPTVQQLAALNLILGEDCRDHLDWESGHDLTYIDLELTEDFGGIKWNGAEKTYDMEKLINVVIHEMRKKWPDFGLTGALLAQGESIDDRYMVKIGESGLATKEEIVIAGQLVNCPHCKRNFRVSLESTA